jgi:preprotein translocase subunit SecD
MFVWKRRTLAGRTVVCLSLLALLVSLAACWPSEPHYTLARNGGFRITLRAACPPTGPGCDLATGRDTAIPILSQRLAERSAVKDTVVRVDGTSDIIVELPRVTNVWDALRAISWLSGSGSVEFLDTGRRQISIGERMAGMTCTATAACQTGQYLIVFTGEQIDRTSIGVASGSYSGPPVAQFEFVASARQHLADYTRNNIGKYLTITADDIVIASMLIQSEIDGLEQLDATGADDAQLLVDLLWSGTLPIELMIVREQSVAPSG